MRFQYKCTNVNQRLERKPNTDTESQITAEHFAFFTPDGAGDRAGIRHRADLHAQTHRRGGRQCAVLRPAWRARAYERSGARLPCWCAEVIRNQGERANHIIDPDAPSAARVVWEHYGGEATFPIQWLDMMEAVDKGDSAQFNRDEVLDSTGWNLLNFLMDARTGLGRFKEFRISNYNLMMDLIEYCKHHSIDQILDLPDVRERIDLYREHENLFKQQIQRCAKVYDNLVFLDLTGEEVIYAGNRFVIYALYPQCNISIHKMWGFQKQNMVFATGKSIFDRSSKTNIGELMLKYGGGGHKAAGTCQIDNDKAEQVQKELIEAITRDG